MRVRAAPARDVRRRRRDRARATEKRAFFPAQVRSRGFEAVELFSISDWREANPEVATLTGMDYIKAWIKHQMSKDIIDDAVEKMKRAHEAKQFKLLLFQTQAVGSPFFVCDWIECPAVRVEVCEWAPNLSEQPRGIETLREDASTFAAAAKIVSTVFGRSQHPVLPSTYMPECIMPIVGRRRRKTGSRRRRGLRRVPTFLRRRRDRRRRRTRRRRGAAATAGDAACRESRRSSDWRDSPRTIHVVAAAAPRPGGLLG